MRNVLELLSYNALGFRRVSDPNQQRGVKGSQRWLNNSAFQDMYVCLLGKGSRDDGIAMVMITLEELSW